MNIFNVFKTKNSILQEISKITFPAFFELVLSAMFGMVDMIMLGRLSPVAIASVGLTNQPFFILLAVFQAVNVGATTLVAWNIGAKNLEKARQIASQTIGFNLILGVITSILGYSVAGNIVTFMGANSDTYEYAKEFFQIISIGLLFQAVTLSITASLRGAGETKIPMFYNLFANFLNIFSNYVLIYGKLGLPALGVRGAAISTTMSRLICCLFALYIVIWSRKSKIKISISDMLKLKMSTLSPILKIGMPAALEQLIMQGGFMLFTKTVASLGTLKYAAHNIGLNIAGLTFSPSMAFGIAGTTLVGKSLGAGEPEKAELYSRAVRRMGMIASCFVGVVFLFFSYPIALLYTTDVQVAHLAANVLKIMALAQPGQSTQLVIAGILRGAGDTKFTLISSFLGIWFARVGLCFIFVNIFHLGLYGAWSTILIDQYIRSSVVYLRFRTGKWKQAALT